MQKQATVTDRLEKPSLSPDDLNSFRPISNLIFIPKVVERAVARQLLNHADQNGLLRVRQYSTFHSMESAILTVHNGIVSAID